MTVVCGRMGFDAACETLINLVEGHGCSAAEVKDMCNYEVTRLSGTCPPF